MGRDIFDLSKSDMDAVREAVCRDLDARLATGARIRSMRDGTVIDEWLDANGTLVSEPVAPLAPTIVKPTAPAPASIARRMVAVSSR